MIRCLRSRCAALMDSDYLSVYKKREQLQRAELPARTRHLPLSTPRLIRNLSNAASPTSGGPESSSMIFRRKLNHLRSMRSCADLANPHCKESSRSLDYSRRSMTRLPRTAKSYASAAKRVN